MKESVENEIQRIYDENGNVTPSMVVETARDPSNPLHGEFEWDNDKAAHQYRLWKARKIIREVQVVYLDNKQPLVHVPTIIREDSKSREGEYLPINAIVKQPDKFERAMTEALQKLSAAERAVDALRTAARDGDVETSAKLAIALEALITARTAINAIH